MNWLLAALALGCGRLTDEELFRRVYGFRYAPVRHQGVFAVGLHRARARLGTRGEIVRGAAGYVLRSRTTLFLADPRCESALDQRVLVCLAHRRRTTAKIMAEDLGIPLRTIQASLRELVDEGVCLTTREGKSVEYAIEDTTFQEPTQS